MNPLNTINGYKTYIAGVGMIALAIYQATQGQWEIAIQSFMAGLAAFGVRHAIYKATTPLMIVLSLLLFSGQVSAQTCTVYSAVGPVRSPIPHSFIVVKSADCKTTFCVSWVCAGSRPTLRSSAGKLLTYAETIAREQANGSHVVCHGTVKISQARYDLAFAEWNRLKAGGVKYRATALFHDNSAENCIHAVKAALGLRFPPSIGRIGGAEIVRQLEKHP